MYKQAWSIMVKHSELIIIRINKELKREVKFICNKLNCNISEFIRELIRKELNKGAENGNFR